MSFEVSWNESLFSHSESEMANFPNSSPFRRQKSKTSKAFDLAKCCWSLVTISSPFISSVFLVRGSEEPREMEATGISAFFVGSQLKLRINRLEDQIIDTRTINLQISANRTQNHTKKPLLLRRTKAQRRRQSSKFEFKLFQFFFFRFFFAYILCLLCLGTSLSMIDNPRTSKPPFVAFISFSRF
jgi:hypothetical protein